MEVLRVKYFLFWAFLNPPPPQLFFLVVQQDAQSVPEQAAQKQLHNMEDCKYWARKTFICFER